uniref:Uncharacterized protein n=1 Tax=Pipistrellus kuhlii TaxID=59472 RepID=A0A7J7VV85_PIPKU|nr:hypothetical protein mPipKuh1_008302 [Pipistrellus kuhlii]
MGQVIVNEALCPVSDQLEDGLEGEVWSGLMVWVSDAPPGADHGSPSCCTASAQSIRLTLRAALDGHMDPCFNDENNEGNDIVNYAHQRVELFIHSFIHSFNMQSRSGSKESDHPSQGCRVLYEKTISIPSRGSWEERGCFSGLGETLRDGILYRFGRKSPQK